MKTAKRELGPGVIKRSYFVHELSSLLMSDSPFDKGANIGANGRNLTVAFLVSGGVHRFERLCTSLAECMPKFAGEVLAVTCGSTSQDNDPLLTLLGKMPFRNRLVTLGADKGTSGNRNAMVSHVKTQWVMCLDGDVYFVRNPLERIQSDIYTFGSRFLTLPVLEQDQKTLRSMGGLLQASHDREGYISVGRGNAYEPMTVDAFDGPGFLSSFLNGEACVFDVESFRTMGGYDEALSAGFEDLDLSLRLFRAGYKVGTTGAIALVHESSSVKEERGTRETDEAASQQARKAGLHFEQKYGYKICGGSQQSHSTTKSTAVSSNTDQSRSVPAAARTKPAVALVVDIEHWAFYNIATQVKKHLGDRFDFDIIPAAEIAGDLRLMLMMEGYDLAHFFWRGVIHVLKTSYLKKQIESFGLSPDEIYRKCVLERPVSTSVYDHLFLGEGETEPRAHIFQDVLGYTVSSERLNRIYSNIAGYPSPSAVITDGVDLDRFRPKGEKTFSADQDRPLVVGWAGNSAWSAKIEDFKGFQTILRPALEELADEGIPVQGYFADRQIRMIPHHEMPDYYSRLDVFVCSSKIEGTPNPVLEAMACGIPVISTDVGIVPEAFGPKQHEFILRERSKDCLKDALRHLHQNRSLLKHLSEENLSSIQAWSWSEKARLFGPFFEQMMMKFHQSK